MTYPFRSRVLDELGVRSWVNAKNWASLVGGNSIDDRVLSAMEEVAKTFVDMHELFAKADQRVAELCGVEEAHITTGAAAAIELAVAGSMAGNDYGKWMKLPSSEGMRNEVVQARGHHISYTPQWTAAGARTVEYGIAGTLGSCRKDLEAAITDSACCLSYTFSYNNVPRGIMPFDEVVGIARDRDLPVIVDAASYLPPVENLHKFVDMGADIVCFSGGKAIRGPNNTGMMVGSRKGSEIIKAIRAHTFPHYGWGRGRKLSKEQIVGLVIALEIFVKEGDQLYEGQIKIAEHIHEQLKDINGIEVTVIPNDEKLHEHPMMPHVPRVLIEWDRDELGLSAEELDQRVAAEDPPVCLKSKHYFNYFTNKEWRLVDTFFLRPAEVDIVVERLRRAFSMG